MRELPTPELTRALEEAVVAHQPPTVHGRRPRLRYAHQGGRNPPVIVVHGNQADRVGDSYRRYLANFFSASASICPARRCGSRCGRGRTQDKRNPLTRRQQVKRRRLVKHTKKKRR